MKFLLMLITLVAGNCYAQAEVFKDSSGLIIGRSNVVNGVIVYTDDIGAIVGKVEVINGQTVYKDAYGGIVGKSTISNPVYGDNSFNTPTPPHGTLPPPPRGALPPLPLPKGVYPWMLDPQ